MAELTIHNLIFDGIVPKIHARKEEDGSIVVEWVFPGVRIGLNIEKDKKESGWHVISKQITASGPLHEVYTLPFDNWMDFKERLIYEQ